MLPLRPASWAGSTAVKQKKPQSGTIRRLQPACRESRLENSRFRQRIPPDCRGAIDGIDLHWLLFRPGSRRATVCRRFRAGLEGRFRPAAILGAIGLALHSDKTRCIEFVQVAMADRHAHGERRPETFDFPGITRDYRTTRTENSLSGGGHKRNASCAGQDRSVEFCADNGTTLPRT